jgi:SAM-dependent methyltransferase
MSPAYELTACVVCGSSNAATIADPDDIRAEAELLWAFHMRRLSPRTPPERLIDRVAFSQPPPWRVVRCVVCGLVFRNPVERREQLRSAYANESPSRDALLALHDVQRDVYGGQLRRLRAQLGRRGTGIEVGSYSGAFLAAARRDRWQFEGLDVNPAINAFVRDLGLTVHDGDLESFGADRVFDVVAIWNTFDQLPDPRVAVRAAGRLLRTNGLLALRVPNGECYAKWRARLVARAPLRTMATAVLAYNNLLTFPYRFGFTPPSLTRLLHENGFEVRQIVASALVSTVDEWTRRWAAIEERVVKPITRRSWPWFEVYARRS